MKGKLVSTTGTAIGSDFVISDVASLKYQPALAFDTVNGRYLVTWVDNRNGPQDIYAQIVNANGTLTGWTASNTNFAVKTSASSKSSSSVDFDPISGKYIVVWSDFRNTANYDIYSQYVTTSGALSGAENAVDITATDTTATKVAVNKLCGNYITSYEYPLMVQTPGWVVAGTACNPRESNSPTSLSFGLVAVSSTSASQNLTITNSGTGLLKVSSIALSGTNSGDFAVGNGTCGSLTPTISTGNSCQVAVTMTPTASGSRSATLTITSNANNTPSATVALSGTGKSDFAAPTTTASPKGGMWPVAISVTLACRDDGVGCDKTYYTTNGSTPTTSSSVYTSAISVSADTAIKFFSTDLAGNAESVKTESYMIFDPANDGQDLTGSDNTGINDAEFDAKFDDITNGDVEIKAGKGVIPNGVTVKVKLLNSSEMPGSTGGETHIGKGYIVNTGGTSCTGSFSVTLPVPSSYTGLWSDLVVYYYKNGWQTLKPDSYDSESRTITVTITCGTYNVAGKLGPLALTSNDYMLSVGYVAQTPAMGWMGLAILAGGIGFMFRGRWMRIRKDNPVV